MKKLMIAAAVICLAVASQAAVAVTWNTGTFNVPNADGSISGTAVANGTAASVYWATITFATDAAMQSVVSISKGGTTTQAYATKSSKGLGSGTGSDFSTGSAGDPDITYYAQVVLHTTVNGTEQTLTSDVGSFSFAGGANSGKTINFTTGSGFDTASNLFAGKTWTAAVPEPTSGLLMLVGLGALALRRRRA